MKFLAIGHRQTIFSKVRILAFVVAYYCFRAEAFETIEEYTSTEFGISKSEVEEDSTMTGKNDSREQESSWHSSFKTMSPPGNENQS